MFFQGPIQQGIASALSQNKVILVFGTDNGPEATMWEDRFLVHPEVAGILQQHAVVIRIEQGTEDMTYFQEIFAFHRLPLVAIVDAGQLKRWIPSGTTGIEFIVEVVATIRKALADRAAAAILATASREGSGIMGHLLLEREAAMRGALAERRAQMAIATHSGPVAGSARPGNVQTGPEAEHNDTMDEGVQALQSLHDDLTAWQDRLETEGEATSGKSKARVVDPFVYVWPQSSTCNNVIDVKLHLLEGITLKSRFMATLPLKDVRTLVDAARKDGTSPYVFKRKRTLLRSKIIDEADEAKSLKKLGISKKCTLTMVQEKKATNTTTDESQGTSSWFRRAFHCIAKILPAYDEARAQFLEERALGSQNLIGDPLERKY